MHVTLVFVVVLVYMTIYVCVCVCVCVCVLSCMCFFPLRASGRGWRTLFTYHPTPPPDTHAHTHTHTHTHADTYDQALPSRLSATLGSRGPLSSHWAGAIEPEPCEGHHVHSEFGLNLITDSSCLCVLLRPNVSLWGGWVRGTHNWPEPVPGTQLYHTSNRHRDPVQACAQAAETCCYGVARVYGFICQGFRITISLSLFSSLVFIIIFYRYYSIITLYYPCLIIRTRLKQKGSGQECVLHRNGPGRNRQWQGEERDCYSAFSLTRHSSKLFTSISD